MNLKEKITALLILYFIMAVMGIASTLYVSWRLEGGAAAINDIGSQRMRSYQIAYLLSRYIQHPTPEIKQEIQSLQYQFDSLLRTIEHGDPTRPLFLPKEIEIRIQLAQLRIFWQNEIKQRIALILDNNIAPEDRAYLDEYQLTTNTFVQHINALVSMVEYDNAYATSLLRSFQIGLVLLAFMGTILLIYLFSHLVVQPVAQLRNGLQRMSQADFDVRLPVVRQDEFGDVAQRFNQMADELQALYTNLEQRVQEKTYHIEIKNRELAVLYEVAASLNTATAIEPLCNVVLDKLIRLVNADDGLVRMADNQGEQLRIVVSRGVSQTFLNEERCLAVGDCLCGSAAQSGTSINAEFSDNQSDSTLCMKEGFTSVVAVPVRSKQRILGMINLFFRQSRSLPESELQLLESVGHHLGIAIENQQLIARKKEMAVSEERNLLAQELHDSIAQSLAFLNIQVQLLRDDLNKGLINEAKQSVEQIGIGVQESYDDVRELLVHFRTRIGDDDLKTVLRNALDKFQGQTGIITSLQLKGEVPEFAPEHILQITHIVQESLSNIRKHAQASRVDVELSNNEECTLCIADNGHGFDINYDAGETHVGLSIMRERAFRIGAKFDIQTTLGQGTRICLTLPQALYHEPDQNIDN